MLDLARLRALHAVHVHGSVGAAAGALGYTPSAVSQQIAKLERETRTTLLERKGRGVALTDEAHLLVSTAQRLLSIVEETEVALEQRRGLPAGRLTMAAFPTAARGILPGVLAQLAADHPALELRLVEQDPHVSVDLVARGVVDLAVAHDWDIAPLPAPDGLERVALGADRCDVLLPAGHPLADRAELCRADLTALRWICQPPGTVCHEWLVRTLRASGAEPDLAYQVAEFATQLALVAAGLGVALVPRLGRGPVPEQVVVRPLEPAPVRGVFALWRAKASRRPAIAETVRVLRARWPAGG
ncbi:MULTISPECIES: LysR family transcriptional regulator [Streptomycetaceae]|uniref:LysR family transcriptional regulator n=1 Tax=Streptantibioticus cattleyicolor (strain ATCC 35852 / DSM 46488 / JCM 4925 / NBRC 14057 / NRRL 8057) TaxID=1003195 RepID=F8JS98_STREN|nr:MULTISPECIES: LysR family transcriptional regulator [Streptomycetaceae]AEW94211.1 LysR family transcriptional regulator [Streptantibioticus cattleyicolor NRRL 8057 = DSM 46488]MYS58871.1 LysR family transcriptional regulator [Streptomyces sp. SID5468]CCB74566.1 putative LysR-family transcriptional regulator [Streptantibioticus cattleyicolor NRRL 8057 = DSM 46488]